MSQYNSFCTVTTSKLYMFIEKVQMTSITFPTCVIMLHFKFFYFKATQNFLGGEGGGTRGFCGQFPWQYCVVTL